MSNYKIVASDLDGTLLNNSSEVSRENLEAISILSERGVYFVPSSGRTLYEIPEEIRNHPAVRYVIYSNGAVVFDKETGKRITSCISRDVGKELFRILSQFEVHLTIRHGGKCLVDPEFQNEGAFDYYNLCEAHRHCITTYGVYMNSLWQYAADADNIEVLSAFFHSYEEKLACKNELQKNGKLRAVESDEYNLEIMSIDAGKGNALSALADMLNIDRGATISIGDSDNDSSITRAAGLGLAVSNASDSLKMVADEIICSNEGHVVPYVLSHYIC